jgi:hypothetical protein
MKGYKVFNGDWTCMNFQYEVGKTYELAEPIEVCRRGFHFCEKIIDCFDYYSFSPINKVAEVDVLGSIKTNGNKSCTNKIKIVREIAWGEVLNLVNTGNGNSGYRNSGNRNSGNNNSGDNNSGNRNSGYNNSGYRNSGYGNSGYGNSGYRNSGDNNSGDNNSGYRNSGYGNSGYGNSGYRNSGHGNTGDYNTGHLNIGSYNTGDFNTTDNSTGFFCTENNKLMIFDKETDMTREEFMNSRAYKLIIQSIGSQTSSVLWTSASNMTKKEKEEYPSFETTGGYLKQRDIKKSYIEWWSKLRDDEKDSIKEIPNFDAKKFKFITGINVNKNKKTREEEKK